MTNAHDPYKPGNRKKRPLAEQRKKGMLPKGGAKNVASRAVGRIKEAGRPQLKKIRGKLGI